MKKIALIAALVIGTASSALAFEQDGNLQNRYPNANAVQSQTLQSAPVALQTRSTAYGTNQINTNVDRETVVHAGGVG